MRIFRRLLVIAAALALLSSVFLGGFWLIDPVAFRLAIFQPVREVRLFTKELGGPGSWPKIKRVSLPGAEKVQIDSLDPDEIDISADLYRPDNVKGLVPGILFLHGSSPYGNQAAFVRKIGSVIKDRGWIMLAPDARGYGDTDDPANAENAVEWEVDADLRRSLTYLIGIPGVDSHRIAVVGHSVGAGHALEGALDDERVKAMVLIGPARYLGGKERSGGLWARVRFSADRKLSDPVSKELIFDRQRKTSIAEFASGSLSQPGHIPILIMDGEREGQANHAYLKSVVERIAEPIEYHTVADTRHYCGVRSFFGSRVAYIRKDMFEKCFAVVDKFLETHIVEASGDTTE